MCVPNGLYVYGTSLKVTTPGAKIGLAAESLVPAAPKILKQHKAKQCLYADAPTLCIGISIHMCFNMCEAICTDMYVDLCIDVC